MKSVFASNQVKHVSRNRRLLGGSLLPAVLGVVAVAANWALFAPFAVPLSLLGLALPYWIWRKNLMPRLRAVSARADRQGLEIDRRSVLRADEVASGVLVPQQDSRPWVRLERKGLRAAVQLQVPDEEAGTQLLRALGRDASQAVACFRGSSLIWGTTKKQRYLTAAMAVGGGRQRCDPVDPRSGARSASWASWPESRPPAKRVGSSRSATLFGVTQTFTVVVSE